MPLWQRFVIAGSVVLVAIVAARLIDRRIARKADFRPEAMTRYRVLRRTVTATIIFLGFLSALLAIPQVRRGMLGDAQSHWNLRHATSLAVAADVLLTGRTFLGDEAVRMGIASRALPAAEVLPAALAIAHDIAERCAPLSLALSKRLLWSDADRDQVGRLETAYHRLLMGTPDATEGPRAWTERRAPQWALRVGDEWSRVIAVEGTCSST